MNLYHRCSYKNRFQNKINSKLEVDSTRLQIESALGGILKKKLNVTYVYEVFMNTMFHCLCYIVSRLLIAQYDSIRQHKKLL